MKHRRDTIGRNGWAPEGFKLPRCLMSCGAFWRQHSASNGVHRMQERRRRPHMRPEGASIDNTVREMRDPRNPVDGYL
jgi:hypothetical protein